MPVAPAILGTALASVVMMATITFGSSLTTLVSHPALYGWNWTFDLSSGNTTDSVRNAAPVQVLNAPSHPYTEGLIEANVRAGQDRRPNAIPGAPPSLDQLPPGCAFAPRCGYAVGACWDSLPSARPVHDGHSSSCLLVPETALAS